jgi:hypothetical protein
MSMYNRRHLEEVLSTPVSRHKVRLLSIPWDAL